MTPAWVSPVASVPVLSTLSITFQGRSSITSTRASTSSSAFASAAGQVQLDLLGRVLVDEPEVGRDLRAGSASAPAAGWAGRRGCSASEPAVAAHAHARQAGLDHVQAHHAAVQLLLGQLDRDDVVAARVVQLLERFEGALDVAEIASRTGVGRHRGLHLGGGQQGIAADVEAADLEADLVVRPRRADGGASTDPRTGVPGVESCCFIIVIVHGKEHL
jgi:hypothetical protein